MFSLIFRTIPGVSAYPGSFHEMWDMFVDQEILEAPKGLEQGFFTRIDFRRNKREPEYSPDSLPAHCRQWPESRRSA